MASFRPVCRGRNPVPDLSQGAQRAAPGLPTGDAQGKPGQIQTIALGICVILSP